MRVRAMSDMSDDERRARLAKACEPWGDGVEDHFTNVSIPDLRDELEDGARDRTALAELRADVAATLTRLRELAEADWCDCFGRTQAFDAAWELLDPSMQEYLKATEAWKRCCDE